MDFYTGLGKREMPDFIENKRLKDRSKYIVSPPLQKAVNVAILLGQPLLITGEPGTGKTQLAHHIADFFDMDGFEDNLFVFNTKSTSTATDLLYRYDSLKHFQYIQNNDKELTPEQIESLFIQYRGLGAAIKSGRRCVVLIDEIDKAPRDLPNDILDVLEELAFEVPEIGRVGMDKIRTDPINRPIVLLTSNSEKNLPDAFLRRCVFFHIPFPGEEMLLRILKSKVSDLAPAQLDIAIQHFHVIRGKCKRKPPATAELLQWVSVLERLQQLGKFTVDKLLSVDNLSSDEIQELQATYGLLVKDKEDLKSGMSDLLGIPNYQ